MNFRQILQIQKLFGNLMLKSVKNENSTKNMKKLRKFMEEAYGSLDKKKIPGLVTICLKQFSQRILSYKKFRSVQKPLKIRPILFYMEGIKNQERKSIFFPLIFNEKFFQFSCKQI